MKTVTRETREVEVVTITCDLCGSDKLPRFAQNRTCTLCQREVCGDCQGPYPEEGFGEQTICKPCRALEAKYQEPINETFRERERLMEAWKTESLEAPSSGEKDGRE
jgi:hypothetical protein